MKRRGGSEKEVFFEKIEAGNLGQIVEERFRTADKQLSAGKGEGGGEKGRLLRGGSEGDQETSVFGPSVAAGIAQFRERPEGTLDTARLPFPKGRAAGRPFPCNAGREKEKNPNDDALPHYAAILLPLKGAVK
jgi:hypothetical protein